MVTRLLATLAVFVLASSLSAAPKPKNVILVIGDGMGVAHVSVLSLMRGEAFRMGDMPVTGLAMTGSADRDVTDSGAGASAFATGVQTKYEALSVDAEGRALPTVLELAEKRGRATGVVTTSYFFDATPAAFVVHSVHRKRYKEIVPAFFENEVELIVGSAEEYGDDGIEVSTNAAQKNGYAVETTLDGLQNSSAARVLALFPGDAHAADFERASLPDLTRAAIERLSADSDGFFLLVEHEGVDGGSHDNDQRIVRRSLTSLDDAVGVALDFARKDGNTLVVVAGDHETGGLRITDGLSGRFRLEWSTTGHTASAVPVFAFGPGAEVFGGFQENYEVGQKLLATQR